MFKFTIRKAVAAIALVLGLSASAVSQGWPANYQGVMLQGFEWNSYDDTKWTNLTSQADELSQYFNLIWVPNSAQSAGQPAMGYMPIYWFTHHNSSFGTESELRNMISTFKAQGTGIIEDVVINHRVGVGNWADFPSESWNGKTYTMGADCVTKNDEWGQGTGANDTGDNYDSARDLDHTSTNVQGQVTDYVNFLLNDLGYAGCRYDMVKGYAPRYTQQYNNANNVQYSIGEYYDTSYDKLAAWIDGTGKTSAAFDFAAKDAINKAFNGNDLTQLVWKANGTTDQPAGLIHYGYPRYAVTFVENHDTQRDGMKFSSGNVVAANAFILCSPGTPCVFMPHWKQYKAEIKKLIEARKAVGVNNESTVKVLKSTNNCYLAEVTGTKGSLVVRIGSAGDNAPPEYTNVAAEGTNYKVWTKVTGTVEPDPDPVVPDPDPVTKPEKLYIVGNLDGAWLDSGLKEMTAQGNTFVAKDVKLAYGTSDDAWFSFVTVDGTTWNQLNSADRYGSAKDNTVLTPGTPCQMFRYVVNVNASSSGSWQIPVGTYDIVADFDNMTVTATASGTVVDPEPDPEPDPDADKFVIYWDNAKAAWAKPTVHYFGGATVSTWPGVEMELVKGNIYKYVVAEGTTGLVFTNGNKMKTSNQDAVKGHVYSGAGDQGEYSAYTPAEPVKGVVVYWDNSDSKWEQPYAHFWGGEITTDWSGEPMTLVEGNIWKITLYPGSTGVIFNNGNGSQTGNLEAVDGHIYTMTGSQGAYDPETPDPDPEPVERPEQLYVIGNINGLNWNTANPVEMSKSGTDKYIVRNVEINNAGGGKGYFSFVTAKGADWNAVNGSDRYGAPADNTPLERDVDSPMTKYAVNVNASSAKSWEVAPGNYDIVADFRNNTVHLYAPNTGIDDLEAADEAAAPVYYNLQGVRIVEPAAGGLYIRVQGRKVTKVLVH